MIPVQDMKKAPNVEMAGREPHARTSSAARHRAGTKVATRSA
jgi:hypothetical protein